jgi:Protein of unknown function (DUF2924)
MHPRAPIHAVGRSVQSAVAAMPAAEGSQQCLTTGMQLSNSTSLSSCRAPSYGRCGQKSLPRSRRSRSAAISSRSGFAYARQERLYGGLSRRVAKELDRLLARALADGNTDKPPISGSPLPRAGTILVREWQATTHHVTVTHEGFLWNGKVHRSLSGIAHAITGTKWNGPRFFGLRDVKPKSSETRNGG